MEIIRLKEPIEEYFGIFKEVYTASFPLHEQRTDKQHIYALFQENYHIDIYLENKQFVGFIVYWVFDNYIYIEHLAIHPEQRSKNYGSSMLNQFIENNDKTIILEIDPIIDEISTKRYELYKKLGFVKNMYQHTHPAYREGYEDHELIILTTFDQIDEDLYKQFYLDLKHIVMNRK